MSEDRIESLTRSLSTVACTELPAPMKGALLEGIAELIQRELPTKEEAKPKSKAQPQEDAVAGCKVSEMDAGLRAYAELLGKKLNVDPSSIVFLKTSL